MEPQNQNTYTFTREELAEQGYNPDTHPLAPKEAAGTQEETPGDQAPEVVSLAPETAEQVAAGGLAIAATAAREQRTRPSIDPTSGVVRTPGEAARRDTVGAGPRY